MDFKEINHLKAAEILSVECPVAFNNLRETLAKLPAFPHGSIPYYTAANYLTEHFKAIGWDSNPNLNFSIEKKNYMDLSNGKMIIEIELRNNDYLFRDFFRFMMLVECGKVPAGVIITYSENLIKTTKKLRRKANTKFIKDLLASELGEKKRRCPVFSVILY